MSYRLHASLAIVLATAAAFAQSQPISTTVRPEGASPQGRPAQPRTVADASVLLVQDVLPWDTASNEQVLDSLGVTYDIVGSAGLRDVVLKNYAVIIIASDQPQRFYNRIGRVTNAVYHWLYHGARTLQFHGADTGWQSGSWDFALPKGVTRERISHVENYIHMADSPLVAGVASPMHGTSASHVQFEQGNVGKSRAIIVSPERKATLLDYCYGQGRVIASGQTVEFAYAYFWDFMQVLPNMITESTQAPGCHR